MGTRVLANTYWNDVYSLTEVGRRYIADLVASNRWDDLRFPATAINPPGAISDPGRDSDDGCFLFDAGGTETIAIIGQMPHTWVEGSILRPHVHWEQDASGTVKWQLEYKFFNNGEAVPAGWTTISTTDTVFAYSSGTIAQISVFPAIQDADKNISAILKMKLSRIGGDDTKAGDAKLLDFDIHLLNGDRGSEREFRKTYAD